MKKIGILIVSYKKDIQWLEYNLRSIDKFARWFHGVTLVVPASEYDDFIPLANKHDCTLKAHQLAGHLGAQTQKCLADVNCQDVDYVLHSDSDCVFTEPVTPEDYFVDGKPVMLMEPFALLKGNPWQPEVERALGCKVDKEFMRRHPQVNPVGVYPEMRRHIEGVHNRPFIDYVMAQKPTYVWGYTEHVTIGAFAFMSHWNDKYHWIDVSKSERPKDKLTQHWSYSPPNLMQNMPSGGQGLPMDLFRKLGIA